MKTRLLIAGSLRVLVRYRLRSFLMSVGIVLGVAAIVVLRSLGSGAQREMLEGIERLFSAGSILVVNGSGALHGGQRNPGRLSLEDVAALQEEIEEVIDADPSLATANREVRSRDQSRTLLVVGNSERATVVMGRGVIAGEPLSATDVRATARVALLGPTAAEHLFGGEDPVGQQIQIDGAPYRVKGVLEPFGADPHGLDRDDEVQIPITTLLRRMLNRDTIGTVKFLISSTEAVDETVERIARQLRERHGLADDAPDDFAIYTPTEVQQRVREANRVLTLYLPAAAGVVLLVAGIVIANLLLIAVRERVPEIGLRKAVGATERQIALQFLLESLTLTLLASLAGVGLGAGVLALVAHLSGSPATLTAESVAVGLAAALVVGVVAGALPARRAARQEPVDALR